MSPVVLVVSGLRLLLLLLLAVLLLLLVLMLMLQLLLLLVVSKIIGAGVSANAGLCQAKCP